MTDWIGSAYHLLGSAGDFKARIVDHVPADAAPRVAAVYCIERVQQLPLCSPSVEGSEGRKIVTSVDGLEGDDGAAITGEKATTQAVSIRAPFSRMRFC